MFRAISSGDLTSLLSLSADFKTFGDTSSQFMCLDAALSVPPDLGASTSISTIQSYIQEARAYTELVKLILSTLDIANPRTLQLLALDDRSTDADEESTELRALPTSPLLDLIDPKLTSTAATPEERFILKSEVPDLVHGFY